MIIQVSTAKAIQQTAKLAHRIWNQHYVPIIGQEQVDYMLGKFQSEKAITQQLAEGYEYYLLMEGKQAIAYTAIVPDNPPGKMLLSKLYVDQLARGKGAGAQLLETAIAICKARKIPALWLTVNRHNNGSFQWYQKRGFIITEEKKTPIGKGYVMDDYFMELSITE